MWHAGSLVAACELLVVACVWDLVPRPGIEPGPPALGVWSLSHWATREVPSHPLFLQAKLPTNFHLNKGTLENALKFCSFIGGSR